MNEYEDFLILETPLRQHDILLSLTNYLKSVLKVMCKKNWIQINIPATFKESYIINLILFYSFLV